MTNQPTNLLDLIDHSITSGQHDRNLTAMYRFADGTKMRVRIRRNSYDFQSFAILETLDPTNKWNELVTIPYPEMKAVMHGSIYGHAPHGNDGHKNLDEMLRMDEQELLRLAVLVLA